MSNRTEKPQPLHANLKKVVQVYLGLLISVIMLALVIGQLNLPYFGKTIWTLAGDCILAVAHAVPHIMRAIAGEFPFVYGAVGVLWLSQIYLRSYKSGNIEPTRFDGVMAFISVLLLIVYGFELDIVAPQSATFFQLLVLYSAMSPIAFCLTVILPDMVPADSGTSLKFYVITMVPAVITYFGHAVLSGNFPIFGGLGSFVSSMAGYMAGLCFIETAEDLAKASKQPAP